MLRNKKGIELSITAIIIVVLSLLVLVVLAIIFTGRTGIFAKQVGECATTGGKCFTACGSEDVGSAGYPTAQPTTKCADIGGEPAVCCLAIAR
jgi:hypothetical protein